MMTLEEAIKHAEEVAESCQLKAYDIERNDYKDLEECAAEHRQLAEWLRELKEMKKTCNRLATFAKDTNVPCKDTISRQAAIDALKDWYDGMIVSSFRGIEKVIKALPSAQTEREKGKWTKDCACEICGFKPWYERDIHTLSFCPNCGADMREEQDDQSKR